MTAPFGNALKMQAQLSALMKQHNVKLKPRFVPLADPVDYTIHTAGLASTTDLDLGRQKFRGYAFDNICLRLKNYPLPPLLYRHDEAQVAGTITSLGYDDKGNLRISAEVTHPLAKLCGAFSVGARVLEYEIKDADSPNFYALITRASLDEVSLTDCPANPHAIVQYRSRPAPTGPYLRAVREQSNRLARGIELIRQQLDILAPMLCEQPAPPIASRPPPRRQPRIDPRPSPRPTQFSELVNQLSMRT